MIKFLKRLLRIGSYQSKENLLIFVGDFGVQALNQHQYKWKSHSHFLAMNTDPEHLKTNVDLPEKHKLYIGIENFCGDQRSIEHGLNCVQLHKKAILRKIGTYSFCRVVVVGALRNSSASGIIPAITAILKNRGIETLVIVSTPFVYEGTTAESNAAKASDMLMKLDIPTKIIAMSQQAIHPGKALNQSIADYFSHEIEKVLKGRM